MQPDRLFQGIDVRAYHLLECVQFLERLLSGATEPLLEDLGGEVDAPIVGDELLELHGAAPWADAVLSSLPRSYLELRSAREAFDPAVEPVEGGGTSSSRGLSAMSVPE